MTDAMDVNEAPQSQPPGMFDIWLNLYFAPRQAFEAIVARPKVLVPIIISLAIALTFILVWVSQMDPAEFAKTQLQASGAWDKMPPEAREQQIRIQVWMTTHVVWAFALIGTALTFLVEAGYFMLAARFFYGASTRFKQILSLTVWTNLAIQVITVPLILVTMYLKGDWNIDPGEAFQANAAALMDKGEVARWMWSLGGSLDLFSFWLIALFSIGLGVAMGRKASSAAWAVVVPWAIIVAIKVGFSAIMS